MKMLVKNHKNLYSSAIILLIFFALVVMIVGCATSEEGSSMPWAEPEPWEQQPNFGVPY